MLDHEARYQVVARQRKPAAPNRFPIPASACLKGITTFAACGVLCGALLAIGGWYDLTGHDRSRYGLWKRGLYPYLASLVVNQIAVDADRNELVRGVSRDDLLRRFPDAHDGTSVRYQEYYEELLDRNGVEHLWIGDSAFAIFLDDGRGTRIVLMKG